MRINTRHALINLPLLVLLLFCGTLNGARLQQQALGAEKTKDVNDPQYKQLAEESLKKFLQQSGNTKSHQVVRLLKVTTQVVAGSLTEIDFVVTPTGEDSEFKCHSKVLEQLWLNKKEIDVTCEPNNERVKRGVSGGVSDADVNDPQYKQLAEESLNKFSQQSGNTKAHQVVRILKVTTQVVAGTITEIDFMVSPAGDNSGFNCHSRVFEQSWTNTKDINVTCEPNNERVKRGVPGGVSDADVNNPQYKQLAEESLNKFLQQSGNTKSHEVVRLLKVTTQVVAGSLTEIDFVVTPTGEDSEFKCHSKVLEQLWLNKKEIDVTCEPNNERVKRGVPGGVSDADVNDPQYKQLAEESLNKFLQQSGNTKAHQVVRILKVTTQVVAGTITEIDFMVSPAGDNSGFNCHSRVFEQSWTNTKDINVTCEPNNERVKRGVPGGVSDADVNNPQYKQLAEESLNKFLQQSGNTKSHEVVRLLKVTTQVVAGSLTEIDFVVTPTGEDSEFKCHSKVLEQLWLNKKEIDVTCEPNNERVKRGVPGGVSDADVNDPQYKQLAEESLNKFLQQSGNTKAHQVVRILKVTTQVVAGTITEIDFMVSPAGDNSGFNCHSRVFEQSWTNTKDINVTCEPNNERVKRGVPGGVSDADVNNPQYKQLAEESLNKFLQQSGNTKSHEVVRLLKVTTQVVAGSLTEIDFVVTPTGEDSEFKCHSKVLEQLWLNKKEIDINCEPNNERVKRGVPGGISDADADDPQYKQLAEDSLDKFLQQSGNTKAHQVVRILKVTTQVVAGTITEIDFMVSPAGDNSGFNCHSRVFEQSWTNTKDINVTCEPNNERVKRGVPGGVSDADVNNPQYKQLAEDSLDKFLQQSGNTKAHQVVRILKVTTQVVAGTITEIDFMVSPAGDNSGFNCHSRVFEQSWTNTKDINVNCEPNNERVKREVIPIGEPNTYTTYIDPKSVEGVDISTYAVNHLNENNKKNKYIISKVPEVEKIIQVEKAIYYIITLVVNEDGCQKKDSELCTEKTFLIKIMEKLFEKLPNGAKNRQVLEVKNESEKNNH